jgi:uncharacterized protein (UPF0335 family)
MTDEAYNVTAEELRGYSGKALRLVIAKRKRKPDEIAEEAAVVEMYETALRMG